MSALGTDITSIATSVGNLIVSLFQSLASIFYTTPVTTESGTTGGLTIFGYLLIFSALLTLTIFVVNWIKGLITVKK